MQCSGSTAWDHGILHAASNLSSCSSWYCNGCVHHVKYCRMLLILGISLHILQLAASLPACGGISFANPPDYSSVVLLSSTGDSSSQHPASETLLASIRGGTHSLGYEIAAENLRTVHLHASAAVSASDRRAHPNGEANVSQSKSGIILECSNVKSLCPLFTSCTFAGGAVEACISADLSPSGTEPSGSDAGTAESGSAGNQTDLSLRSLLLNASRSEPDTCPNEYHWATSTRMIPSQCLEFTKVQRSFPNEWSWQRLEYLSIPGNLNGDEGEGEGGGEDPEGGVSVGGGRDWSGMVFLLHDVFVDRWGRVFNDTHFFDAGRCSDTTAQVSAFPEAALLPSNWFSVPCIVAHPLRQ